MKYLLILVSSLSAVALVCAASIVGMPAQGDVLATPATMVPATAKVPLIGIAVAGKRLVAVGVRGSIMVSDTQGRTWRQVPAPVSSDLVAVHFPTPELGWAVGHDGVVLHSRDSGASWTKQLDGNRANALMEARYAQLAADGAGGAEALLKEAKQLVASGPALPLLDVWFKNAREGYVVGAFNLIFHTADGGQRWEPLYQLTDNPKRLHMYAVSGDGNDVYIAGEQGLLLKLDSASRRFTALPAIYNGTFFGILAGADRLVAYGLRGHAFASGDGGATWQKLATGTDASFAAGLMLGDGRMVLGTQAGQLFVQQDGKAFIPAQVPRPSAIFGIAAAGTQLAMVGSQGAQVVALVPLVPK